MVLNASPVVILRSIFCLGRRCLRFFDEHKRLMKDYIELAGSIVSSLRNLAKIERKNLQTLNIFWFCAEKASEDTRVKSIKYFRTIVFT